MKLSKTYCTGLLLTASVGWGGNLAFAADPADSTNSCPWQGEQNAETCERWEAITQRIDAAAKQAEQSAQALESPQEATAPSAEVEPGSPEARARAVVDKFLEYLTPPIPDVGGFEIERNYAFTQQEDMLTTRFAKAAWVVDDFRVDFGPLTFNVEPGDEGLANVEFSFGDILTLHEGDKVLAQVLIGEQQGQGVWDETIEYFSQSDVQLANIDVAVPGQPVIASLAKAGVKQVLERDTNDNWSNRQEMQFQDLQVQAENYAVTLANTAGYAEMVGRDYKKLMQVSQDMNALLRQQNLEEAETFKQFMGFMNSAYGTISRLDSELVATDLLVGDPGQPLAKLAKVTVGGQYAEAEGGSTFGYSVGMEDLATQSPGLPAELIPTDARFEAGLFNITAEIINQFMEVAMASEKLPEAERDAYMNKEMSALFLNSNLGAYLKDTYVVTPATRMDMNMRATVDSTSPMGGIGEFNMHIEGLDKALEASQAMPGQESAAPILGMLMAFSNRTQEGDKVIDSFALKLGADGKLILNDKDVTAMFMPQVAGAPGQELPESQEPQGEAAPE